VTAPDEDLPGLSATGDRTHWAPSAPVPVPVPLPDPAPLPALLELFDRRIRRGTSDEEPGAVTERLDGLVRRTGDDWNGILWSGLDESTADAAIAAQTGHFRSLGRDFEWKLYGHDAPADLGARLLAAGFVPEPEESLMVAEVADVADIPGLEPRKERHPAPATVPAPSAGPTAGDPVAAGAPDAAPDTETGPGSAPGPVGAADPLPAGVRLVDVTDPAGVELMARVHQGAFGTDPDDDGTRARLMAQLGLRHVVMTVAVADGVPVAVGRLVMHPGTGFAGLWGGGTLPEWRGRGIYRALVAHRALAAAARGYRWLQVDASDRSRPILERLGFRGLTTTTPYVFRARDDN
jgi:GNAT superfamily N-acetyltransferase